MTESACCSAVRKELDSVIKQLRSKLENNKMFTYMVVHDLKHPTESLIDFLLTLKAQMY